jgi:hypothetical protein
MAVGCASGRPELQLRKRIERHGYLLIIKRHVEPVLNRGLETLLLEPDFNGPGGFVDASFPLFEPG